MQRIGFVRHISSSGNMIVEAEAASLPRIGDHVKDENLKTVGWVFDIFGPVSSPYVSVRADVEDPGCLVNHVLYAVPSPRLRKERRKR